MKTVQNQAIRTTQFTFGGLLTLLLSLIVCGCQKDISIELPKDEDSQFKSTSSDNNTKQIDIIVEASLNPNQYRHLIKWSFKKEAQMFLYSISKSSKKLINHSYQKQSEFSIPLTTENREAHYLIEKHFPDGTMETITLSKNIPRDYIFSQSTTLEQPLFISKTSGYNRVFFKKNVVIQTLQHNLIIDVNEIIIDGSSTIETFPEGRKAKKNTHGKSGGHIRLRAQRADGSLTVFLRGESGGDGSQPQQIPGAPAKAKSGKYNRNASKCILLQKAEKGQKGQKGNQGLIGKNGGHTGELYVETLDDKQFVLSYFLEPGQGGQGGPGGLGQEGGLPGTIAFHFIRRHTSGFEICKNDAQPSKGARGDLGNKGDNGRDGKSRSVIIKLPSLLNY